MIVFTATSQALSLLADVLRTQEESAIEKFFQVYQPRIEVVIDAKAWAVVDSRQPRPFKVSLLNGCLPELSESLKQLATLDDYAEISLGRLGNLCPDTSKNDVIFRKVDLVNELKRDYDPANEEDRGATWEGVLYPRFLPQASICRSGGLSGNGPLRV
ncbi:hypothetical protein BH10CYA1_BH10CYA1_48360 [soil metagenome]